MQIGENNPPKQGSSTKGGVDLPKGWWAQRMDTTNSSASSHLTKATASFLSLHHRVSFFVLSGFRGSSFHM